MRIRAIGSVLLGAAVAAAVLLGCNKKSGSGDALGQPAAASGAAAPAAAGQLRVTAGEHGFSPASLDLPKGAPGSTAAVTFVRVTDKTCATEVVFPDLNLKKDLPLDTPVTVDVPTENARTLTFQCGMAMYKGALVVR
jgi:plastocyanin domain-containing protein